MTRPRARPIAGRGQSIIDMIGRSMPEDRAIARVRRDTASSVSARSGEVVSVEPGSEVFLPAARDVAIGSVVGVVGAARVRVSTADDLVGGRSSMWASAVKATMFMATSAGRWEPIGYSHGTLRDYGAIGDGATDDTAAIQRAISALAETGGGLEVPDGVFLVSVSIAATLEASAGVASRLYGTGTIRAASTMELDAIMLDITTGARSLEVQGVTLDCNSRARCGLRAVEASDADAWVTLDRVSAIDAWLEASGGYSAGIALFGGWETIRASGCTFSGSSRKAGIASAGSYGLAIEHTSSYYAKRIDVAGSYFKNISCNDAVTDSDCEDVDGLHIVGGVLTGSSYQEQSATVSGCHFVDCKGRGIKMQRDSATITGCTVYRSVSGIYSGFGDINFQGVRATIANCTFHYSPSGAAEEVTDGESGCSISVYSNTTGRPRAYAISNCHAYGTVRGALSAFIQAGGSIATDGGNNSWCSVDVTGCTIAQPHRSYLDVTPAQSSSNPSRSDVVIRGGRARGTLHGFIGCTSGSALRSLIEVALVDCAVYPCAIVPRISAATKANPCSVTTTANHGLLTGDVITIEGSNMVELNGGSYTITKVSDTVFTLDSTDSSAYVTAGTYGFVHGKDAVVGATQADPVEIETAAAHGLASGDVVHLRDLGGMTEVNNRGFVVTVTGTHTFTLDGEDGTSYTAYTSGGELSHRVKPTFITGTTATAAQMTLSMDNTKGIDTDKSPGEQTYGAYGSALRGVALRNSPLPGAAGLKTFSFLLADDESAALPTLTVGNALLFAVHTSFGDTTNGWFYADSGGVEELAGTTKPTGTALDSDGTPGANPDTDGSLCLWYASSRLNVKNRLGSARTITLLFVGA